MTLEFHPEAIAEFEAAALHYEATRPGLGARFTDAVEATVQRIVESPQTWRVVDDDVRRCLTHVFPYGVLYTIERDFILILAISHLARRPGYWKARR
jgi:toxin ParE1/3/4